MKRLLVLYGCFVFAGLCWIAWAIYRDVRLEKGFDKIRPGDTESEVLQALGRPKRIEPCGEFMGPLTEEELKGCAKEYFYASPFAPLLRQYYVVRFDGRDRVKNTTPYSSP